MSYEATTGLCANFPFFTKLTFVGEEKEKGVDLMEWSRQERIFDLDKLTLALAASIAKRSGVAYSYSYVLLVLYM